MDIILVLAAAIVTALLIAWALSIAQTAVFIEKGDGKRILFEGFYLFLVVAAMIANNLILYLVK